MTHPSWRLRLDCSQREPPHLFTSITLRVLRDGLLKNGETEVWSLLYLTEVPPNPSTSTVPKIYGWAGVGGGGVSETGNEPKNGTWRGRCLRSVGLWGLVQSFWLQVLVPFINTYIDPAVLVT